MTYLFTPNCLYIFTYSPSPLLPFLPPPSLLLTTSLLSVSVNLFLFCYNCPFVLVFKLHRQMKTYSVCLSLSYFTEQPHLLSQTANFHYFLLLSNILHHVCMCVCVYVCVDIYVYIYIYIYTSYIYIHHMSFLLIFIGVYLIYNVVLVSSVHQSESVIHLHISTFFSILFPYRSLQSIE